MFDQTNNQTERPALKIVGDKPRYDEELRQWLEKHITEYPHLMTTALSHSSKIGTSRSALDAYLNGTYFLAKDQGGMGVGESKIEEKIRAYRIRVEGTERHNFADSFIETRAWMQFQHACHTAISENAIVVVYGKPGLGKSRCLLEYSTRKMTGTPIQILCSANITTRYFVQKIARDLGIDDRPPTAKLEDLIAEKLKKNVRPLFVDQANYLNEKALGTICYLWEKVKLPIILLGTKDLYELFITTRLTEDVRAQLSSRVAMHYPLMELGEREVKTIITRAFGKDATDEVVAKILNITQGIHRHVDMILPRINDLKQRNAEKLASGEIVLADVIETAGRRLMVG